MVLNESNSIKEDERMGGQGGLAGNSRYTAYVYRDSIGWQMERR